MRHEELNLADPVPNKPDEHHVIGQSQNFPEDLTNFMQSNVGDPAAEVSLPVLVITSLNLNTTCYQHFILKLRTHILPRIAAIHQELNPQASLDTTIINLPDDFFFFPLKCIEVSYLMSHYTTQQSQLRMATD